MTTEASTQPPVQGGAADRSGGLLDTILHDPHALVLRYRSEGGGASFSALLLAALLGLALYGAAMGTYQGGGQVLRSMVKTPLVVFGSLLLCLPSLYVFVGLTGGRSSLRRVAFTCATYAALISVILVALVPITWLFSAASESLWFVTLIHLSGWALTLLLARQVLRSAVHDRSHRAVLALWALLFLLVSLQLATHLRPLLWHETGAPFVTDERLFFLEHFHQVIWKSPGR